MATDFTNMVYDPQTGTTKKKQNPYLNPNETSQGYLPYTGQDYTPQNLEQGNQNVMGTAQQAALSQPQNTAIQDQTTQMTQKLMADPNMGRDWTGYNKAQMSKFDADRASGVKAFKETNAGMGGAGQVQDNLIRMALTQNTDRGLLENELEQQAYEKGMQNYITALGQGREQGQYLDESQQNYINNLLNVRGAYEGERAQTSAEALQRELTAANIMSSEKIAGMDIASSERIAQDRNVLDKYGIDVQKAQYEGYDLPNGQHVYGQGELAGMKFGLESKDLENQTIELFGGMIDTNGDGVPDKQVFGKYDLLNAADKRDADQLYGYDVRDAAGNVIGHVNGSLQLENDRTAIEAQGLALDRAKIMGYDKDTNGDGVPDTHIDGELDLAMKQQGIDLQRLGLDKDAAYGYIQTDADGNPVMDENGNPVRVKGSLELKVEELGVERMLAELQRRSVDTAEIESIYGFINNEIDAGRASPDDALDYLNFVFEKNGVSLTEADKNAIYGEIAQDFKAQEYQFALANPELANFDDQGNFIDFTEEGKRVFSNYANSTLYGGAAPTVGGGNVAPYYIAAGKIYDSENKKEVSASDLAIAFRNADNPDNQNNEKYQQFVANAKTFSPRISSTGSNTIGYGDVGLGDVVNVGGRLMVITSKKRNGRVDNFTIMDVASGESKYFDGFSSSDDTVRNFDAWAAKFNT